MKVKAPKTCEEYKRYYLLRWRILRKPWRQPLGSERDGFDGEAIHAIACEGGKIIGVGRGHFKKPETAQIRYMAVDEKHRGLGVGSAVLKYLEEEIKKQNGKTIELNARDTAVGFYLKNGYQKAGKAPTLFNTINQTKMRKKIIK
jgi:ribosomal protein S18 acetylase RimI-like enzyme